MDVGFVGSLPVFDGPNVDVYLAGSAPGAFVFPNENGELLVVILEAAANVDEAGCCAVKPPMRPNNEL
jgi:hypothetical protein